VAPAGPLGRTSRQGQRSSFTEALTDACASANVLLTLAPVDPSVGGDHLISWATDAVAVITAGRASWTKIHAAGEMIRLSGVHLASAVLVGADKTDDSLGAVSASDARHAEQGMNKASHAGQEDSFTVTPGISRRRPDDR
jgi:hypothetical protein